MRRKAFAAALILVLLLPLLGRKMELEDIFRYRAISSIKVSPDGREVLFLITKSCLKENRRKTSLWLLNLSGEEHPLLLVERLEGIRKPAWVPASRNITFLALKKGKTSIFILPERGEARVLLSFAESIRDYAWLPDASGIIFTARKPDKEREERRRAGFDEIVVEQAPPYLLWLWDRRKDRIKQLNTEGLSVREFAISPDGRKVALVLSRTPLVNDMINGEIYLLDLQTGKLRKLTSNRIIEYDLAWSPDSRYIYFLSQASEKLQPYYQASVFRLDPSTGRIQDLLPGFRHEVTEFLVSREDGRIYMSVNEGVKNNIYCMEGDGKNLRKLTDFLGFVRFLSDDTAHGFLYFVLSTADMPFEMHRFNLAAKQLERLTFENSWADEIERGKVEVFHWRSRDGRVVEGILYYPANFNPKRKYPLLVQLHGGPESSYRVYFSTSWVTYTYYWTGRGFVVFQPNYRGSTGYGDDVMRAIIGAYFEKDIDDIITGIKALKRRGWVGKIAVMGWSAGGHLTNWLVTHYRFFSAASSGAGMANWFSFYAQTDMRFIREIWHKGPPYERVKYYLKKSPVFYTKGATTPTIIFCGEKDERVPLPQSREMYFALKWAGVKTKLIVFPGEPHGLRKPAHQLTKMREESSWIQRFIFGKQE